MQTLAMTIYVGEKKRCNSVLRSRSVSNFFLPQAIAINIFYVMTLIHMCAHTYTHNWHKISQTLFYHLQCYPILFSISVKKHQSQSSTLIYNLWMGHNPQFEKRFPRFSPSDLDITNSHIPQVMEFTLHLPTHLPRANQFDLKQFKAYRNYVFRNLSFSNTFMWKDTHLTSHQTTSITSGVVILPPNPPAKGIHLTFYGSLLPSPKSLSYML